MENTEDIYYNTSTNYNNINNDKCYFKLYNSSKKNKVTIICKKEIPPWQIAESGNAIRCHIDIKTLSK